MKLCHSPASDWRAWLAETVHTMPDHMPDHSTAPLAAGYVATCRNPSRDWQAWLAASAEAAPLSDVANYVQLCQNPAKDWRAWIAEDHQPRNTGGLHDHMESTERISSFELYEVQSRVDAIQGGGFGFDYLPSRPATDPAEPNGLRPLRSQGGITPADRDAADAMQARRFAMLQRFMRAARLALLPVSPFRRRRRRKGKSQGKATSGGRAFQIRKDRHRTHKRRSFLERLGDGLRRSIAKASAPLRPPRRPTIRPPPRHSQP
jgi:hypothetical protein